MLRITVRTASGVLTNGAAFHIGDGVVITARHVVDGVKVEAITPHRSLREISVKNIRYPSNKTVDLALIETDFDLDGHMKLAFFPTDKRREKAKTDHIPLGGHLNDWVGDEFVLSKVLLMGFPIIPLSQESGLVAVVGEVNAVVDKYSGDHPHFIISTVPRAGFSGGPVISEYGFLLGVLTESLIRNSEATELGFAAAISIEPLLNLLAENNIRPPDFPDDIWTLFSE